MYTFYTSDYFCLQVNTKLVRVLVDKGGVISAEKDEDGANALHHLAQQCMGNDLAPLLKILAQEVTFVQ